MSKITMKYELRGKENNREVWRSEKIIQRHMSKFSLNGDSLVDKPLDLIFNG